MHRHASLFPSWCELVDAAHNTADARSFQRDGGPAAGENLVRSSARSWVLPAAEPVMTSALEPCRCSPSRSSTAGRSPQTQPPPRPRVLDPDGLPDHIDLLYRAACALCGSRHDAEDLVQETFVNILKRPRMLRDRNEIGYLLRALRNTHANRFRTAARRPATRQLFEDDLPATQESDIDVRE